MKYSASLSNIATALAKIQAEIKNPIKDQINKGVQGAPKYANLEDTLQDYVRPVCAKHGVSVFQSVKSENNQVGVCTVLIHESGEYIESDYVFCDIVIPTNSSGKKILTEGQATGVCITYLRRYSLNAALGINGDKDTDGSYDDKPVEDEPLTYETALAFEITFGKHKGKTLKELWKEDNDYIQWLYNGEKTDPQIKEAITIINAEIQKRKAAKA
ncbi:MAG: ERF family protein [Clostridia bacterium]|nr:ERF family protein [Clostridia bacterium]